MSRNASRIVLGLVMLAVTAAPVRAQSSTAEVRTVAGETYQLTDASLEMLYTIMLPKKEDNGPAEGASLTGAKTPMLFGSAAAIGKFLDKGPEPLQGRRHRETITLSRNGVETRVALADVRALMLTRQRILSSLPPYVAPEHYRYAGAAVLVDGSRVEADYVNLGTTFLRGTTTYGRVDIQWEQIETLRFAR